MRTRLTYILPIIYLLSLPTALVLGYFGMVVLADQIFWLGLPLASYVDDALTFKGYCCSLNLYLPILAVAVQYCLIGFLLDLGIGFFRRRNRKLEQ